MNDEDIYGLFESEPDLPEPAAEDPLAEELLNDDILTESEEQISEPVTGSEDIIDDLIREYDNKGELSDFFEQQAAFGQAFSDSSESELSGESIAESVSFIGNGKTPVIDSDGMIVIYDSEKGIDATGAVDSELAKMTFKDMRRESRKEKDGTEEAEFFGTDDNLKSSSDKRRGGIRELFPKKGDGIGEIIRKCVFLTAGVVFIGAGIMLISTLVQSGEAQKELDEIRAAVTTTVATTIDEYGNVETIPPTTEERLLHNESIMSGFIEVSGDVRGFIELPGCDIYYPVVQGEDNSYYLTHTYDNKTNKAGAIFIDYRCVLSENYFSPNIVLYGHNQEDGTMFGNLKMYKNNVDFYKQNPFVTFNTEYGLGDYVIFAYFVTNVYPKQDYYGEVFHYHDYINELADRKSFRWYINQVEERNQIIPTVDVRYGDQLLVLSTCSNEYSDSRFVVIARRLRCGEEKSDFDFSGTQINPNAKKIDWDAVLYGRTAPSTMSGEPTSFSITTVTVNDVSAATGDMSDISSETTVPESASETSESETSRKRKKKKKDTETVSETEETTTKKKKETETTVTETETSEVITSAEETTTEKITETSVPTETASETKAKPTVTETETVTETAAETVPETKADSGTETGENPAESPETASETETSVS